VSRSASERVDCFVILAAWCPVGWIRTDLPPSVAPGVLRDPPPKVFLIDFAESAVQYEIKFWLMDGRVFPDIIDGVRTNVWYELNRRNIRLAFTTQQIELVRGARLARSREGDSGLLASQPLFSSLDQIQLNPSGTRITKSPFRKG
jgi:hypothetical protein